MRIRALMAVGLLAGAVLLPASVAVAQEDVPQETEHHEIPEAIEENSDLGKEELECLAEQVEAFRAAEAGSEDARVDTCEESPNPILPATNEIIWGAVAFLVVFALMWRLAIPQIKKALKAREDRIRADLESAETARGAAEETLEEYRRQLADARNEAARIIDEARQAADAMRREVQESAESEATAARERAQAEIEQTASRARADLQREMADFAVRLAERIVERNLDRQAQQSLIDEYIAEVGAMSGNGGGAPSGN